MINVVEAISGLDPKDFGRRLKALRLELDLTLNQMAEAAGVSADTIRSIEDGERARPNERTLYRLMKTYPALANPDEPEKAVNA